METYRIVRMYFEDIDSETVDTGLTLEEAQEYCKDPETSSSTATSPHAVAHTNMFGPWFDGYEEEGN